MFNNKENKTDLRQKAEDVLSKKNDNEIESFTEDNKTMIHELQVHQIELKMQNEELQKTNDELEKSEQRYLDLYNKAPVGYFELNSDLIIKEANVTALKLLNLNYDGIINNTITKFILKCDQDIFYLFRKKLQILNEQHSIELRMLKSDGNTFWAYLEASLDKDDILTGVFRLVIHDITERKNTEDEIKKHKYNLSYQAHHDALTKLPNRILFNDKLEQAIEKAKQNNVQVALLFIDLDHFKDINESLGHTVGDEILKTVSIRLTETVRAKDTVARLGGDEFAVILEDLTQIQDASLLATKILEVLSKEMKVDDNILYVPSSIGISIYPDDGKSTQNLLKFADSAMFKAKDEGRNNFQYYNSTMTELAFERVFMEASLRNALKNEEFIVYYQPQVNGNTNQLIGMEALVRWQHPTMGLVSPDKFIPLAEITGLIVELDRYVMKIAMTQIASWYMQGLNPGILSMNLAVKQLQQTDLIEMIVSLLKETKCKAQWIELEVTEGQIMTNPDDAIKLLTKISDLGIELAVDDFGTGYSSLAYLKRLPIDKLKIDQAFIKDLPDDDEDSAITKAIITLSKSLNLKIIAEGVETKEQKDFIVENGCDNIQGYYYSKPIPSNEIEIVLENGFNI